MIIINEVLSTVWCFSDFTPCSMVDWQPKYIHAWAPIIKLHGFTCQMIIIISRFSTHMPASRRHRPISYEAENASHQLCTQNTFGMYCFLHAWVIHRVLNLTAITVPTPPPQVTPWVMNSRGNWMKSRQQFWDSRHQEVRLEPGPSTIRSNRNNLYTAIFDLQEHTRIINLCRTLRQSWSSALS
jgi:hypothetical protein